MENGLTFDRIWIPFLLTCLAGFSTGLGSILAFCVKDFKDSYFRFSLGLSAGAMVYISFVELLSSAVASVGFLGANIWFFIGIFFILLIDFLIPHQYGEERVEGAAPGKKMMNAGMVIALGLAIHNFPEGLAVFMSSLGDIRLGLPLAVAIAIHNIPEGVAVSTPIYYATGSRKKAFWFSFLSGVAEPIGALAGIFLLFPYLNEQIMAYSFAFVAGIMVFIGFDEVLPLCYREEGAHLAISGVILGMAVMALSIYLL
ncbi:MAG: zinc transporter ZupT [Candidatus Omnitrophica bacterium]|nr:zinc transporter ZupT [Candidatus Omnitrophota bacterium]